MQLVSSAPRPSASAAVADAFFRLGIAHSLDSASEAELVAAHKWFNLASLKGNPEAANHREEIALGMTPRQISLAQRAAREWLAHH